MDWLNAWSFALATVSVPNESCKQHWWGLAWLLTAPLTPANEHVTSRHLSQRLPTPSEFCKPLLMPADLCCAPQTHACFPDTCQHSLTPAIPSRCPLWRLLTPSDSCWLACLITWSSTCHTWTPLDLFWPPPDQHLASTWPQPDPHPTT